MTRHPCNRIAPLATLLAVTLMAAAVDPLRAQSPENGLEEQAMAAIEALLGAIRLPEVAAEARDAGVADSTLTVLIGELRDRALPAAEAERVLDQEMEVLRAGGPPDRFGAFVRGQLDAGLRGRELAAAIRAEHRARGIGIPDRRPERALRGQRGNPRGRGPGETGVNPSDSSEGPDRPGRDGSGARGPRGPRGPGGDR